MDELVAAGFRVCVQHSLVQSLKAAEGDMIPIVETESVTASLEVRCKLELREIFLWGDSWQTHHQLLEPLSCASTDGKEWILPI